MPPRVVKRGGGGAARRGGRVTRSAVKAQNPPIESADDESVNIGETSVSDAAVDAKEETPEEEVDKSIEEDNQLDESKQQSDSLDDLEAAANPNDVVPPQKETVDDLGKDERLDLDDNDPEYDADEYGGEEEFEEREEEDHELVNQEEEEEFEAEVESEEIGDLHESEGDVEEAKLGEAGHVEVEEEDDILNDRRKRKEFEIFVGSLDKGATEEDLKKVFGHVGEVTEVRIVKNPQTNKSKGYAFLRFATVEQAKRAVKELKSPMINGKKCGVTASQDNDTLFIANICKTWTSEALREKLKHYDVESMDEIALVEDSNNANMNRGYAFLDFASRSDAMDAHKRLIRKEVVFGLEKPAKVSFADSFLDPEDEMMAQVKTIFIDGLSTSWSEEHVRDLLKRFGKLEKIELARNMPSARRKDFGFVTFDTHEAAVTCAKSINNSELGEGEDKAKVRARLSRPLHGAGKGRQPSRSDHRSSRHGSRRSGRSSLARLPPRSSRGVGPRAPPPSSAKRANGSRGRRPRPPLPPPARARPSRPLPPPARSRPLPPPSRARPLPLPARSYDRRPPVPPYPKASLKRDYGRREDLLPPRSRPAVSYSSSRLSPERHLSYRDDYAPRGSVGYSDIPRDSSRLEMRRPYGDDLYSPRFERPPPSYSEGRSRAYDEPLPGSKRPYAALDDIPPRYADVDARHSRARLDYDLGPSQYGESFGDRIPRSSLGYGSSRNAMTSHDSRGPYSSSRQGMDYGGGSYSSSDVGGMYSSSYGSEPPRRDVSSSYGSDIPPRRDGGGSSYSSVYSSRGLGGTSYSGGGGGPGSYY
ncbi:hypothetical protein Bca4012_028806 [Brassica carinata]|uniref:(rape) hypothetical protein n=1 Tax=Brassica napus TaxID=3708 RepID=A0A816JAX1_BRANA|nr:nucleolin-like isoform X1 [Brassica napus]XP_013691630.2 nucleolin-like isoform X1 [Brassica napus]CAF1805316.1 unnamed protein product [Brassica napus]